MEKAEGVEGRKEEVVEEAVDAKEDGYLLKLIVRKV